MAPDAHREARAEAQRLIRQLVELLDEGEHLGAPARTDHRIVIPIEASPSAEDPGAAVRALLAAWLDHPPPAP